MDYLSLNKETWNKKVDIHVESEFYDNENFIKGKSSLKDIELALLGDVAGKKILHLQCHFGQDSISLARMGAEVTAIDFSEEAIKYATSLNEACGTNVNFVLSDVYSLPNNLDQKFDIIFTSYGVIGWLPDTDKWASVVDHFLKPNGKLIFVEFHPVVWMYDNDFTHVAYSYFKDEAIVEEETGSYTDGGSDVKTTTMTWNHSTSEVINALLSKGLKLLDFQEYKYSPYACFSNTEKLGEDKYIIKTFGNKIPLVYSLVVVK